VNGERGRIYLIGAPACARFMVRPDVPASSPPGRPGERPAPEERGGKSDNEVRNWRRRRLNASVPFSPGSVLESGGW